MPETIASHQSKNGPFAFLEHVGHPLLKPYSAHDSARPSVDNILLNRYGHVVGVAGNGFVRAFISRDPTVSATDLGTLGGSLSMGYGINNYSWVVGWSEQTNGGGPRAFVHDGTRMTDLNTVLWNGAGWLLREANAINDAGQIAGEGFLNGQPHTFFLQPMAKAPVFNPCGAVTRAQ